MIAVKLMREQGIEITALHIKIGFSGTKDLSMLRQKRVELVLRIALTYGKSKSDEVYTVTFVDTEYQVQPFEGKAEVQRYFSMPDIYLSVYGRV